MSEPAYRHVLLATDFSEHAVQAARMLARLAPRWRARVTVAHVLQGLVLPAGRWDTVSPEVAAHPERARPEDVRPRLADWARLQGLGEASAVVLEGRRPGNALAEHAKQAGADLIVLGARGHSRVERLLLGSTAQDVVHAAPCDTFLVRPPVGEIRRLLVATDFAPPAEEAIERARLFLEPNAEATLVHVRDRSIAGMALEPENAEPRLRELNQAAYGGRARVVLAEGQAAETVARVAADAKADLLAIGNHGAGAIERLLLGSVAQRLVEQAPCSVLLVRG